MARKLMVAGRQYTITTENGTAFLRNGTGELLARITSEQVQGTLATLWKIEGRIGYRLTTKEEAAKRAIEMIRSRNERLRGDGTYDIELAHADALAMVKASADLKLRTMICDALAEDRARTRKKMRATLPMLTVHERDGYAEQVAIYGGDGGTVYIHRTSAWDGDAKSRAEVNWSAFGSVSVQTAREYAMAILRAADEAEAINRKAVD